MSDKFLDESIRIADALVQTAIHSRGTASWVHRGIQYPTGENHSSERMPYAQCLNASFYSGTAGAAFFLAQVAKKSGDAGQRRTSLAAIRHSLQNAWLDYEGERRMMIGTAWRFGHYLGALGIAWAALNVGTALGDTSVQQEARRIVRRLSEQSLDAKAELDLMFGAAGGVASLIDMSNAGWPEAESLTLRLGELICQRAERSNRGVSWRAGVATRVDGGNLLGLSHGVAGIATALSLLYRKTGEERYRELALDAFAYERSWWDEDSENWPHFGLIPGPGQKFGEMRAWCHGAPGIGVSRAVAYPILKDDDLLKDLTNARKTTARELERQFDDSGVDMEYCHGVFGNAECLWVMDRVAGDRMEALATQRKIGDSYIRRHGSDAQHTYGPFAVWPTSVPTGVYPSLMTGLAGVGYHLLRLHDEELSPLVFPGAPR